MLRHLSARVVNGDLDESGEKNGNDCNEKGVDGKDNFKVKLTHPGKIDNDSNSDNNNNCKNDISSYNTHNADVCSVVDNGDIRVKKRNRNTTLSPPKTKRRYLRRPQISLDKLIRTEIISEESDHPDRMALRLKPSLTLLASIVYLSLVRLKRGVAPHHILSWTVNGSFPYLLNAYSYLPADLQNDLRLVKKFFADGSIPHPEELERNADLLIVACRLDMGQSKLTGVDININTVDKEITNYSLEGVNGRNNGNNGYTERNKSCKMIQRDLRGDNIPLMVARFVADIGLGQRVLDITLALMGLYTQYDQDKSERTPLDAKKNRRLPFPLEGASPDKLVSPLHIMAVIVVACKMCPGWETWKVVLSPDFLHQTNPDGNTSTSGETPQSKGQHDSQRTADQVPRGPVVNENVTYGKDETYIRPRPLTNRDPTRLRFIPWNEDQFAMLGNGSMINDYLDYIEEMHGSDMPVLKNYQPIVDSFKKLYSNEGQEVECKKRDGSTMAVLPNLVLAGGPNPNVPKNLKEKDHNLYWHLMCKNKGAIWADANGKGEYVIYEGIESHTTTTQGFKKQKNMEKTDPRPFHPHYGLLIEFIAFKTYAEPSELHYLVANHDEEILRRAAQSKEHDCRNYIMALTKVRGGKRRVKDFPDFFDESRTIGIRNGSTILKCSHKGTTIPTTPTIPILPSLFASCDRCRARKRKCNGARPCSCCVTRYLKKMKLSRVEMVVDKSKVECVYSQAKKRGPIAERPGLRKDVGSGGGPEAKNENKELTISKSAIA